MPIKFSVFIDKIHGQSDTAGMQTNAPNAAGAPVLLPSAHSPLCWYDGHGCHDKGCLETGGGGVCQVSKYLNCCKNFPLPHNRKNTAYLENTSFSRWTFQLWSELDNVSAEVGAVQSWVRFRSFCFWFSKNAVVYMRNEWWIVIDCFPKPKTINELS